MSLSVSRTFYSKILRNYPEHLSDNCLKFEVKNALVLDKAAKLRCLEIKLSIFTQKFHYKCSKMVLEVGRAQILFRIQSKLKPPEDFRGWPRSKSSYKVRHDIRKKKGGN